MQETDDDHIGDVARHYDALAQNGPYGTLAPGNRGGRKSLYVSEVFDAALLDVLSRYGGQSQLLDFGCGTGIFTCKAASIAREVIGLDISSGMLDQARAVCREMNNVRLERTSGDDIALPDECVDTVVAREVLCYVSDAKLPKILSELRRVTRPGGHFLWLEQVSNNPRWQFHPKAPNLVKRSPRAIHEAATDAGWQITAERIARTPRFPWIYPVWLGLIPRALIPTLARWEVAIHAGWLRRQRPHRWWDALLELRNPEHG